MESICIPPHRDTQEKALLCKIELCSAPKISPRHKTTHKEKGYQDMNH